MESPKTKLSSFRHRPFGDVKPVRQARNGELTGKWTRMRRLWIMMHPTCARCGNPGEEVHHVLPRESHPHLRYDWSNLMTLCVQCHKETHRNH